MEYDRKKTKFTKTDTDYQTTANIYTHVRDEMLKKATVNMNEVFQQRTED